MNRNILKNLLQISLIPMGLLSKLIVIFYKINLKLLINKYDLFFSSYLTPPQIISENKKIKKSIIVHDLIPLLFSEMREGIDDSIFFNIANSYRDMDYLFTVSNNTKKDLLNYYKDLNGKKVHETFLACDKKFKPQEKKVIEQAKSKYNIPQTKKYIFSLCTLEPRKNLIRAVKTFIEFIKKNNINDLVLVLGGGQWDIFISTLEKEVENLGDYKSKIIKAGYIDDEDLAPLYSGAEWFVYTSMYEGFGLPPLEAMSCGCPVITSNNSSIPEVVGNAGVMIDWDSDEQHIKAYENYYFNQNLKEEYSQKGIERAKQFSWKKCAKQMINKIKEEYV